MDSPQTRGPRRGRAKENGSAEDPANLSVLLETRRRGVGGQSDTRERKSIKSRDGAESDGAGERRDRDDATAGSLRLGEGWSWTLAWKGRDSQCDTVTMGAASAAGQASSG